MQSTTGASSRKVFIGFKMGWSALYQYSVSSMTYKTCLQWLIWSRWPWWTFHSTSKFGIWICREVGKHEKPWEIRVLHTVTQEPALPQLLGKTLGDDLFKISNQFHSSGVEPNMGNNSNWGRKKDKTTKSNKNVNYKVLTSLGDTSKCKTPAAWITKVQVNC